MAAPTLVASYQTSWTTLANPKTVSVTTEAGDRVLVVGSTPDAGATLGTPAGNSLTYSLAQSVAVASYTTVYAWTATDATGGTAWTLQITRAGAALEWGFGCLVFRDSDGFGASSKTNVASGAPSLDLTTTQAESTVLATSSDWTANTGARTWRTINGITPTAGNALEKVYATVSGEYTTYTAIWDDVGATGAKTTGLSAPTGQKYSIVAVEIKGVAAAAAATPLRVLVAPAPATSRAAVW